MLQPLQHTATKMSYRILEEIYRAVGGSSTGQNEREQPVILKIYIAEFPTKDKSLTSIGNNSEPGDYRKSRKPMRSRACTVIWQLA